jgi:hypothetical protein
VAEPTGVGRQPDVSAPERFREALAAITDPELAMAELLPTRLAMAAARASEVDGLGLSLLSQGFRVPLGASDAEAASAERLQFTTGEGPCLDAMQRRTEIRATEADIARRWPAFYAEMIGRTSYRSVVSLPLRVSPTLHGAIDMYFRDPSGAFMVDLTTADDMAAQMARVLRTDPTPRVSSVETAGEFVPAWLHSPSSINRFRVWIGAGVLMSRYELTAPDALARLRAYAYSHDQDLDEVASALIDNTLARGAFD